MNSDIKIDGVEQVAETIINMEKASVSEVKPLIKEAAAVAKKKSTELAPTVIRKDKKTYKPKLPRAIRRRQSDQGPNAPGGGPPPGAFAPG